VPDSSTDGKVRRLYRSPRRSEQARETRERVVASAARQFVRAGYAATTMRSVAAAAQVSVPTVERLFGSKARLLKAAIDVAIAGDHDPVAVLDRGWVAEAQSVGTAAEFLAVVGRVVRPAMTRSAGLVLAAFQAATTDETLAGLARELNDQRTATVAWIVDGLRRRTTLRAGVSRRLAIDEVWLLMDPAVYERLTRHRGWTPARYEKWFTETVLRLLVD
jgi:TetR/AcrR family transcriptional regulator, regulator of autoinduction and epiphytic fitness